jgi:cation diffusion facilitator family transporter
MSKHSHQHDDAHNYAHGHSHVAIDPAILTNRRGVWAIKWSFAGLFITAIFQLVVTILSGSVGLLAETIHNFGDATTALPLWFAFVVGQREPNKRFTYGYGRVEDLAGVAIVLTILLSAVIAGYQSVSRLFHPSEVGYLWAVAAASVIGFLGNECVAVFRIRVGKEIGSAALVADGYHARVDGLTSLAVLFGAAGIWLGFPLADPIVGLLITAIIARIVWQSGKSVFTRLLDGVDPAVIDEIKHAASHTPGVLDVAEVRVRWLGHRMHAEVNLAVNPQLSVEAAHEISKQARHELLHHLPYLSNAIIHIDPANASGEQHHRIAEHAHGDLPAHSH